MQTNIKLIWFNDNLFESNHIFQIELSSYICETEVSFRKSILSALKTIDSEFEIRHDMIVILLQSFDW